MPPPAPADLTAYLHEHIPLSRAMAASVRRCDESGVEIAAPLAPNLNHRGTAFGGSVASLALLAGWTLLHARLQEAGLPARLVIQETSLRYLEPVDGEFTAGCAAPAAPAWERFHRGLVRKGAGRIALDVVLHCGGRRAAEFRGEYVALAARRAAGGR